jgi:transcriptional regulator with XRE-family HTH domain
MIVTPQIRAARGLIGWTQQQLAKATGLSLAAINNLERGIGAPRVQTLHYVQQALERAGVEFTESSGVRLRGEIFEYLHFEGKEALKGQTDDMIAHIPRGGYAWISSSGEELFAKHGKEDDARYQAHARANNIDERIIVPQHNKIFLSPQEVYRWLPARAIGTTYWMVYADRVAWILWGRLRRTIIIHNPALADTYRKQFEFMWDIAKPFRTEGPKPGRF